MNNKDRRVITKTFRLKFLSANLQFKENEQCSKYYKKTKQNTTKITREKN